MGDVVFVTVGFNVGAEIVAVIGYRTLRGGGGCGGDCSTGNCWHCCGDCIVTDGTAENVVVRKKATFIQKLHFSLQISSSFNYLMLNSNQTYLH